MLKYKIVKQRNSLSEGKQEMYYPRLTGRKNYGLDHVASIISLRSTVTKIDIVAILAAFEQIIPELLLDGSSITLGDLGTFSIHARATASTDEAQVSARNFEEVNIRFKPGRPLKLKLSQVKFRKSDS